MPAVTLWTEQWRIDLYKTLIENFTVLKNRKIFDWFHPKIFKKKTGRLSSFVLFLCLFWFIYLSDLLFIKKELKGKTKFAIISVKLAMENVQSLF